MRAPTSRLFAVPRAVAAEAFAPGEDVAFLEGAASASVPPAPGQPGPTHRYGRLVRWVGGSATGGGSDEAEVEDSPEGSVRRLPAAALFKLQAPISAAAAAASAPAADGGPTADSAAPPSAEPGSGPSPAAAASAALSALPAEERAALEAAAAGPSVARVRPSDHLQPL